MLRRLILFFFVITNIGFAVINDEIKLFSSKKIKEINDRVKILENQFDISFIINIENENNNDQNKNLNNIEKTVIISLVQTKNKTMKLNLKFSNDLEVLEYKDDINDLLNNLEPLMLNGEYQDFIYELTANISDIINLINLEQKKVQNRLKVVKIFRVLFFIVLTIGFLFLITLLVFIFIKKIKKSSNNRVCDHCGIRMRIFDKIEKKNKVIKIYKCTNCGRIKQIITKKRY